VQSSMILPSHNRRARDSVFQEAQRHRCIRVQRNSDDTQLSLTKQPSHSSSTMKPLKATPSTSSAKNGHLHRLIKSRALLRSVLESRANAEDDLAPWSDLASVIDQLSLSQVGQSDIHTQPRRGGTSDHHSRGRGTGWRSGFQAPLSAWDARIAAVAIQSVMRRRLVLKARKEGRSVGGLYAVRSEQTLQRSQDNTLQARAFVRRVIRQASRLLLLSSRE